MNSIQLLMPFTSLWQKWDKFNNRGTSTGEMQVKKWNIWKQNFCFVQWFTWQEVEPSFLVLFRRENISTTHLTHPPTHVQTPHPPVDQSRLPVTEVCACTHVPTCTQVWTSSEVSIFFFKNWVTIQNTKIYKHLVSTDHFLGTEMTKLSEMIGNL